jgi:hypothetical protein
MVFQICVEFEEGVFAVCEAFEGRAFDVGFGSEAGEVGFPLIGSLVMGSGAAPDIIPGAGELLSFLFDGILAVELESEGPGLSCVEESEEPPGAEGA